MRGKARYLKRERKGSTSTAHADGAVLTAASDSHSHLAYSNTTYVIKFRIFFSFFFRTEERRLNFTVLEEENFLLS